MVNSIQNVLNVGEKAQKIKVTVKGITENLTLKELELTVKIINTLIVELSFEHHTIIFYCDTNTIKTAATATL